MKTVVESSIICRFEGYKPGRVYTLADGTRWRQECRTSEYVLHHRTRAHILADGTGWHYLDVEGTSSVVLVRRVESELKQGRGGAF
jgi:hypothetical protein